VGTTSKKNETHENRVLIFMPTGRDGSLVCAELRNAGIEAEVCPAINNLTEEIARGAGAVLIAEEALTNGATGKIGKEIDLQPVWSDLPFVLFAGNEHNANKLLKTVGARFNATIVERPTRITMLVSVVSAALRSRQRQYQTRDLLSQLEQADRQKDLFLATLSHELRTPLNSVLGWIQLLKGASANEIDLAHALDVIERNAKAQSEMISDILFVSRIITGKLTLNLVSGNVVPMVSQSIDVVRPSVDARRIQLQTSFGRDLPPIKGDPDRLQQVFWNLLSNAIKFTPPGGQINVTAASLGDAVEISISDSGEGIEPEFLPFVFERFRQADSSYTRKIGGLGLGLAIVRHLIELHGGSVRVESRGKDLGAKFSVVIPAVEAANENSRPAVISDQISTTAGDAANASGIHVLLVEDDDDSREMLEVMFGQHDIKTSAVSSAAEALEAVPRLNPDVLISDVGLPGEDGYSLMRKIRQLPTDQGGAVPAIALTGYVSQQDRSRAFEVGYQEHMSKPVNIDKLLDMVLTLGARERSDKRL
jgi:signal transduction histidine kinase/CheY-like chemotaxis protein